MKIDTNTAQNTTATPILGMRSYAQPFFQLYHGDCLVEMDKIKDKSIDMILADLPYGTTACKWDVVIPFEPLWKQYERIIKDNGAIVLTGSQPFTSLLICSNLKIFKYEWIWEKSNPANINCGNSQPMKYHESIVVFAKNKTTFNKINIKRSDNGMKTVQSQIKNNNTWKPIFKDLNTINSSKEYDSDRYNINTKNPSSIIFFNSVRPKAKDKLPHPTQKPVSLMEYLILTYTNEGDIVLDNTMGSGTTGVACKNLNRSFIGIEKDEKYFNMAKKRIELHNVQSELF